ncbi:hypothetical protein WMY93_004201 [Mugilogobius chulae]|uniref:Uncharacterized protein n=1 Tax=Mugilogobius chulae TaxID=88201 RepID=A0AAW0Q2U5_9GOBI
MSWVYRDNSGPESANEVLLQASCFDRDRCRVLGLVQSQPAAPECPIMPLWTDKTWVSKLYIQRHLTERLPTQSQHVRLHSGDFSLSLRSKISNVKLPPPHHGL